MILAAKLSRVIRALAGLAPFQLAFVVRDLEAATERFNAVLGAGPWRGYLFDDAAAGDTDIGDTSFRAGAIDDGAAADYQIQSAHAATPSFDNWTNLIFWAQGR